MTAPRDDGYVRLPRRLVTLTVLGVAVLLWGVAGWSWTVPALALAVAIGVGLLARLVGVVLPREGRWIADRAGVAAAFGALAYLVTQASPTATFVAGLLVAALALAQRSRLVKLGALLAGAVLAVSGLVGIIATAQDRAAAYQAAGDVARGQLLPDTPADALLTLMRAVSRPNDPIGCALLDDPAAVQFASAYRAPDCPAALRAAGARVVDPDAYDRIEHDSLTVDQPDPAGPAVVDGCAVRWRPTLDQILGNSTAPAPSPGPPLGVVTVAPAYGTGWIITDFRRC